MGSVEKLITDNLPIWSSSIQSKSSVGRGTSSKRKLYGVKKLRELILDLAVRGLLVPQDPNDEPASVLIEKIVAEKGHLLKNQKGQSGKCPDNVTFSIPLNWHSECFGNVYTMEYGKGLNKADRSNTGEFPVYGSNGIVGSHKEACIFKPCVVIGRKGSAGALNLSKSQGCWITDVAYSVVPPGSLNLDFVLIQLETLGLDKLGKGIKPGLNRNEAYALKLCFPPVAEQYRIVAKVDELMALCDTLEQQQENSIQAHETLIEALLEALTNAADADAFQASWQRISAHFDVLFTTEHSIGKLKETILQLAVMGKLVPQDSNDEPASMLVKKITEKRAYLKQQGLKTRSSGKKLGGNEIYIAVPNSWEYMRLGDIAKFIDYRGKTPTKTQFGVKLITAKNIKFGHISKDPEEFISSDDYSGWMTRGFPEIGDVLFTTEAPLGNVATININEKFALAQRAICFQFHEPLISRFVVYLIMSKKFQNKLNSSASGMTAKGVKASVLKEIGIPLPPLAEQCRIITKLDSLMALCDQLTESLQQAQQTQIQLTDAVVENAL